MYENQVNNIIEGLPGGRSYRFVPQFIHISYKLRGPGGAIPTHGDARELPLTLNTLRVSAFGYHLAREVSAVGLLCAKIIHRVAYHLVDKMGVSGSPRALTIVLKKSDAMLPLKAIGLANADSPDAYKKLCQHEDRFVDNLIEALPDDIKPMDSVYLNSSQMANPLLKSDTANAHHLRLFGYGEATDGYNFNHEIPLPARISSSNGIIDSHNPAEVSPLVFSCYEDKVPPFISCHAPANGISHALAYFFRPQNSNSHLFGDKEQLPGVDLVIAQRVAELHDGFDGFFTPDGQPVEDKTQTSKFYKELTARIRGMKDGAYKTPAANTLTDVAVEDPVLPHLPLGATSSSSPNSFKRFLKNYGMLVDADAQSAIEGAVKIDAHGIKKLFESNPYLVADKGSTTLTSIGMRALGRSLSKIRDDEQNMPGFIMGNVFQLIERSSSAPLSQRKILSAVFHKAEQENVSLTTDDLSVLVALSGNPRLMINNSHGETCYKILMDGLSVFGLTPGFFDMIGYFIALGQARPSVAQAYSIFENVHQTVGVTGTLPDLEILKALCFDGIDSTKAVGEPPNGITRNSFAYAVYGQMKTRYGL